MKKYTALLLFLVLAGCASGAQRNTSMDTGSYKMSMTGKSGLQEFPPEKRIIVLNADITIETDNTESLSADIINLSKKYNGYVLSSGNRKIVIRIDAEKFKEGVEDIARLGTIIEKRFYSEDITEEFRDAQIRLDNKLKARDRYLELLKKAENVEATLKVEKELERLNEEIDSLKGKITRLSHLAQFSTITIYLQKKVRPGPLGWVFWGLYKGIKFLFVWD